MSKKLVLTIFLALFVFAPYSASGEKTVWKEVSKGLEYTLVRMSLGVIHAFRIDPTRYKFSVVTAKDLGRQNATVEWMGRKKKALVAINGGFFTPEYNSLGLLVNNGKILNPLKDTSWWSVFFIKNDLPGIVQTKKFEVDESISFAVQSGPRLLINGSIPKLKPSIAERSAICVNEKNNVIIVATENLLIQLDELASFMKKKESQGGLGCRFALNLDGGSSTQLFARIGSFILNVPGTNKVANAIVIYPKS